MPEFNRTAHILATLAALTPSEIDRIAELRVTGGEHFDPMMEEIRTAVREVIGSDERDTRDLTGADAMQDANIVGTYDSDRVDQLMWVLAARDYDLADLPGGHIDRDSSRAMDVIGYVLDEVFIHGADQLMSHLNDDADQAEVDHDGGEGGDAGSDSA